MAFSPPQFTRKCNTPECENKIPDGYTHCDGCFDKLDEHLKEVDQIKAKLPKRIY